MRDEKEIRHLAEICANCSIIDARARIYYEIFFDALNYVLGAPIPKRINEEVCMLCDVCYPDVCSVNNECNRHFGDDKCLALNGKYEYDIPIKLGNRYLATGEEYFDNYFKKDKTDDELDYEYENDEDEWMYG